MTKWPPMTRWLVYGGASSPTRQHRGPLERQPSVIHLLNIEVCYEYCESVFVCCCISFPVYFTICQRGSDVRCDLRYNSLERHLTTSKSSVTLGFNFRAQKHIRGNLRLRLSVSIDIVTFTGEIWGDVFHTRKWLAEKTIISLTDNFWKRFM